MSKAWEKGSTYKWRKTRAQVLLNNELTNGGMCRLQITGTCTGKATQVHHTRGKEFGDDPDYLLAVCRSCNLRVGKPTNDPPGQVLDHWK
jgi:hypothetical protein